MKYEESDLIIPDPVSDQKVYISGFGIQEVIYIGISFLIDIFVCVTLNLITHSVMAVVLCAFSIPILTGLAVRKDERKKSAIDKISEIVNYSKAQHKYYYERFDWIKDYEKKLRKESEGKNDNSK